MSCRKCVKLANEEFCTRCGAFLTGLHKRVVRERKFLDRPQADTSEILSNLRLRQHKIRFFPANYSRERPLLVDFIFEQGKESRLCSLTQHISIFLMDYVHSLSEIPTVLFESVALSCILIASKSEQSEKIPKIQNYPANIKSIELEVLSILDWKLHVSTVLHFIQFYSTVGFVLEDEVEDVRCVGIARKFAVFLCELCIGECRFAKVFPEELAICCLAAGRKKAGVRDVWAEELIGLTHKNPDSELLEDIMELYQLNFPE